MAHIDLTTETFNDTLENNDIVIIDFWAEWCGPCREFAPIFEDVAENNPDVVFGKVNTEEQQSLATQYGVSSIPTLMVVRDGIILLNQAGMLPEDSFEQMVQHVRDMNMDEVRADIAKAEEADA